jgi:hypothetical protein
MILCPHCGGAIKTLKLPPRVVLKGKPMNVVSFGTLATGNRSQITKYCTGEVKRVPIMFVEERNHDET